MVATRYTNGSYTITNQMGYEMKGLPQPGLMGVTPTELMESSLSLCVSISLQAVLERDGYDLVNLQVSVKGIKAEDAPSRLKTFQVDVQLPDKLDDDYRQKLLAIAEKACTMGNTLKENVEIQMNLAE